MRMQGYCDVYKWTILTRTSPEVRCLHPTSSRREMCTLSVSNVIYHKFSHGVAFYTLNGKNVNVMLESRNNHKDLCLMQSYWSFNTNISRIENEKGLCAYIFYKHIAPFHSRPSIYHWVLLVYTTTQHNIIGCILMYNILKIIVYILM